MFTGIVESIGTISAIQQQGSGCRISIQTDWPSADLVVGASVAINGCCLTVIEIKTDEVDFEAGSETLGRTNLGELKPGSKVNLERAMRADGRLDGHIVTGHIDCVGKIIRRTDDEKWSEFWIEVPAEYSRQMASKGSVAVDGVSLTLVEVADTQFSVALIPHTLSVTILGEYQQGTKVNIETDVLAKYVQKQIQAILPSKN